MNRSVCFQIAGRSHRNAIESPNRIRRPATFRQKESFCIGTHRLKNSANFSMMPRNQNVRVWRQLLDFVHQLHELFVLKSAVDNEAEFLRGRLDGESRTVTIA